jgi:hypothetical protein
MEPDRPQHERPAASVIAHQYSSAKFCLNAFLFPQGKKNRRAFQNVIISSTVFSFLKITLSLKFGSF